MLKEGFHCVIFVCPPSIQCVCNIAASSGGAGSPGAGGVQFYVHEPRTREEDGIREDFFLMEWSVVYSVHVCV